MLLNLLDLIVNSENSWVFIPIKHFKPNLKFASEDLETFSETLDWDKKNC
jgi:hypothetical protein